MSANNTFLAERLSEVRASAEASMVAKIIGELTLEPSAKRFTRTRPQRVERWLQLASVAGKQADGLAALAKAGAALKRAPRKPSALAGAVPILQAEEMAPPATSA